MQGFAQMNVRLLLALSLSLFSLSWIPTVEAQGTAPTLKAGADPKAIAKYRHNQMEIVGKHNKALRQLVNGEVDVPGELLLHAEALAALSKDIPRLFPAGTGPDQKVKSDSKAAIWKDWDKFVAESNKAAQETTKLVEVVKAGDMKAIGEQLNVVGKSCGSWHDLFRVED